MLELRPTCENCDRPLPPNSTEAMICTFECTFCAECVETVLANVCPNCGGGFAPRPIRPATKLGTYPASTTAHHRPVDASTQAALREQLSGVPPELR